MGTGSLATGFFGLDWRKPDRNDLSVMMIELLLGRGGRSGVTVELLPLVLVERTESVEGGLRVLDWEDDCLEWRRRESLLGGMSNLQFVVSNNCSFIWQEPFILLDASCFSKGYQDGFSPPNPIFIWIFLLLNGDLKVGEWA